MRQPGLGKFEWIDEDRRKQKEGGAPGDAPHDAPPGEKPVTKRQAKKADKAGAAA
jgi:hypothetical protein